MQIKYLVFIVIVLTACSVSKKKNYQSVISGIPWYLENGDNVSAHGANIIKDGDKFYLFGEYKNNVNNKFEGFSCYSSSDLINWKFERIAMPPNQTGRLSGADCIGERPKVMKCPSSGEFIMYMHVDSDNYKNPAVEYAVSRNITGPYEYKGRLMFGDTYIRRWDMGTFQDDDGTGYIILHHGDIYKLADDYKSVVGQVLKHDKILRTESPAVFKRNGTYYWIGSGLTGWERNDNNYFTAKKLSGPWTKKGVIAPEGSLTWNSQSTYVLPVVGDETTTYMYMGDRWSFPKQRATATYVWQPLVFEGDEISMPVYHKSWSIDIESGQWKDVPLNPAYEILNSDEAAIYGGLWVFSDEYNTKSKRANKQNATVTISFKGSRIALQGVSSIDCGYGHVIIKDLKGKIFHDTCIDMYSKKTVDDLQYMSPVLPNGEYTLIFSPTQSHWYWTEKSGKQWGSMGTYISFTKALVFSD